MTREQFRKWTNNTIHLLDGATGSNLQKAGMPADVCPETWVIENPSVLIKLQQDYIEAGSEIIYASTFGANRLKLKSYGLSLQVDELNRKLVAISKEAAGEKALVAGDISMTGESLEPNGTLSINELIEVYKEQALSLSDAGVDLIVIETMMSLQELRAAVIAVKNVCKLPIMTTITFERNGRTLYGTDAGTALLIMQGLDVDAVGINCGCGPEQMTDLIKTMSDYSHIPLIAKPNAGIPTVDEEGRVKYSLTDYEYAEYMKGVMQAGTGLIGGCCGTTPDYINKLNKLYYNKCSDVLQGKSYLCTERKHKEYNKTEAYFELNIGSIGGIEEELSDNTFDSIYDEIEEASEKFTIIMLNMDIVPKNKIPFMICEMIQMIPESVYLGFTGQNLTNIESALLAYPGIAAIKEKEYRKEYKKYGAVKISEI